MRGAQRLDEEDDINLWAVSDTVKGQGMNFETCLSLSLLDAFNYDVAVVDLSFEYIDVVMERLVAEAPRPLVFASLRFVQPVASLNKPPGRSVTSSMPGRNSLVLIFERS
jgi:hypothetical protein